MPVYSVLNASPEGNRMPESMVCCIRAMKPFLKENTKVEYTAHAERERRTRKVAEAILCS
jgi:hypothetical protein